MNDRIHIDIETFSDVDIKLGVHAYSASPNFEILMVAYAINDGHTNYYSPYDTPETPTELIDALFDADCAKMAHNAPFEFTCLSVFLGLELDRSQWHCTAVLAANLGLPRSLKEVAKVLKLDQQKDSAGTLLINYFAKPCKPTKRNGYRTRNLPHHDPEKWEAFGSYCEQDVNTERAVYHALKFFKQPKFEREINLLDWKINDKGILIDRVFVENVLSIAAKERQLLVKRAEEISALPNVNSPAQIKKWLTDQLGYDVVSITKDALLLLLEDDLTDDVREFIEIRQQLGKTSTKKYDSMIKAARPIDDRIGNTLLFYGAARTGRWAGRVFQTHNIPQNHLDDLDGDRNRVLGGSFAEFKKHSPQVFDTASQLIRTALISPEGMQLVVADFKAIEARVITWLAGDYVKLETFREGLDIYKVAASQMFNIPYEDISSDDRSKGKIAELALGFQGGVGAIEAFDKGKSGWSRSFMQELVNLWRKKNPKIKKLWLELESRAKYCVQNGGTASYRNITFGTRNGYLFIKLPSGRYLSYYRPHMGQGTFGTELRFMGTNDVGKFMPISTYGGKLTENVVQGTARDFLANSMVNLDRAGWDLAFHVHDEAVAEEPIFGRSLEEMCSVMEILPTWAPDFPLKAVGFTSKYYKK